MRVEKRHNRIVLVSETAAESLMLDQVFGDNVDSEGLIAKVSGEVRLSDGYAEHYIALQKAE